LGITRREFLELLAGGAVALGGLRLLSLISTHAQADLVRPPGAVEEAYFKRLCVRCGICLEVCPTKAIVLAGLEAHVEAIGTPRIEPTVGPCEFYRGRCETGARCAGFCPTGALQPLSKEEVKMGTAEFSSHRCLAYMGKECIVCKETCPVPGAITVISDLPPKPDFHGEKCVGCGICVYHCPAEPKALTLGPEGARRARWLG